MRRRARRPKPSRRHVALGTGVLVAGAIAIWAGVAGRTPGVAANIGTKPDTEEAQAEAQAQAEAALRALSPSERFAFQASQTAGMELGDAHLREVIDIDDAHRIDDAYYIPLPDGKRAVLTLDHSLQRAAESALDQARAIKGAVVLMSVDGRILALAGRDGKESDPSIALRAWAPAASIFKIVTAAALVNAGVEPKGEVCYHGGVRSVQASNLEDDPRRDNRCNDLAYALAFSQNAIMAKLVHAHLQPPMLREMAEAFGFGDKPSFALTMEPGRADIPDEDLEFAKVAAGFWQTELSPMGGAILAATVASGGFAVTPRLVSHVQRGDQMVPIEPVPPRRVLPEAVALAVNQMLIGTTEAGTARKGFRDTKGREFLPHIEVAGKTGTLTRGSPDYLQYSWFVGFAPADNPEYVVSVLVGNGELWHLKGHTVARMALQAAF